VLVFSRKPVSDSEMQALDWELPSSEEFRKQRQATTGLQE
jgi:hypothetical protein